MDSPIQLHAVHVIWKAWKKVRSDPGQLAEASMNIFQIIHFNPVLKEFQKVKIKEQHKVNNCNKYNKETRILCENQQKHL